MTEPDSLQRAILSWYGEAGHLDPDGLSNHLSEIGFAGLIEQLLAPGAASAWFRQDGATAPSVLEG